MKFNMVNVLKRSVITSILLVPFVSFAGDSTGKVDMLENWRSGNTAFTLDPAINSCNGQVVLNYSDNGTRNMYSAILAAKISGKTVRVIYEDACGSAEGYGGSYNRPVYIYVNDD